MDDLPPDTHYDKLAANFIAMVQLASMLLWPALLQSVVEGAPR